MPMIGNYITAKEASIFYKCTVEYARRKLRVLAQSLNKRRIHNKKPIPDIKHISYLEFAEAHNTPISELERILR